ncbi:hypothetical protein BN1221_01623c [Brenneria goodwinii]|uniref:Uncharacterized protein n=1 Tax=Brenneria goodwinii TaxID=1109412 RepID=A0A0G4JTD8_9GAMM|nr:hypothetical protein BN1221_01623c [Brenneria goodwinii]
MFVLQRLYRIINYEVHPLKIDSREIIKGKKIARLMTNLPNPVIPA